jgi:hypothetical protein
MRRDTDARVTVLDVGEGDTLTRLFAKTLVRRGHVRSFHIGRQPGTRLGWEICEQSDRRVLHRHAHSDWHHVERERERFGQIIDELRLDGWRDA